MKITKKLLEQYIREAMSEAQWWGKPKSAERIAGMNQGVRGARRVPQTQVPSQGKPYKPRPATIPKSNIEREKRITSGNKMTIDSIIEKCVEMAPTIQNDQEFQPAVELIAAEIAMQISSGFHTVSKDGLLKGKYGTIIKRMLQAALDDRDGKEPRPYGSGA
jgi:hypothetical protein